MQTISSINTIKYGLFKKRAALSIPAKLMMVIAMAGLTGLLAQVRIPLPFTPVPVTGQVLAVLMAGVLLGKWWGSASMALYATAGIAGLPWFNGFSSGLGATGGYILGFIPAALFLGHFVDKYVESRRLVPLMGLMLAATLLYYIPGTAWLALWLNNTGVATSFSSILALGVAPFIVVDIIKALVTGLIAFAVVPKQDYSA
ncbi:MAG: biotin transporter BioY [Dehalococcoidales bacterium]|jgi:biotin transport system substrate-specific component|nr:biotin transporter BioY [Dehalococcoidales bacterium]